jgi:hypothetical protein
MITQNATTISSGMQTFMQSALANAISSGQNISTPPNISAPKSGTSILLRKIHLKSSTDYNWSGPDAQGWYDMSYSSYGMTITEKVRYQDTTIEYVYDVEYHQADADYSYILTTKYTRYTRNKQVLYKGYNDIKLETFGTVISSAEWRFDFVDYDPNTGAGNYDWSWGSNSLGASIVPYHHALNVYAYDKGNHLLHVKVTWDDGAGIYVLGSWEYDTPWVPVTMPEIPAH